MKLPTYDKSKLVGTVGDTLIHLVAKNEHLPKRPEVLNVLMSLGSFGAASLKVTNASNRTALEELGPPYSLRVPLASYAFNLNVRLREARITVARSLFASHKKKNAGAPRLLESVGTRLYLLEGEQIDRNLRAWNQRGMLWLESSKQASSEANSHVVMQRRREEPVRKKMSNVKHDLSIRSSSASSTSSSYSSTSSSAPEAEELSHAIHPLVEEENRKTRYGRIVVAESERATGVRVPFVDGGQHRGLIMAHRWVLPKAEKERKGGQFPALFSRKEATETSNRSVEDEIMARLQFCVEWWPPLLGKFNASDDGDSSNARAEQPTSLADLTRMAQQAKESGVFPVSSDWSKDLPKNMDKRMQRKYEHNWYTQQITESAKVQSRQFPPRKRW